MHHVPIEAEIDLHAFAPRDIPDNNATNGFLELK